MLELYHGSVSTASERVRLVLEEKGLTWTSRPVDLFNGGQHQLEYRALNRLGQVPTLLHDGLVLRESSVIGEYLDDAFPENPVRPVSARDRARARLWDKTIDEVHTFTGVLTYAIAFRPALIQQPKDELAALVAAIADPARRAARQSVLDHGVAAPEVKPAVGCYVRLLDEMEAQLTETPYLASMSFSTADIAVVPFVTRIHHLAMGALIAARPRAKAWLEKIQARPAFRRAVTDIIPSAVIETFKTNGAAAWPALSILAA